MDLKIKEVTSYNHEIRNTVEHFLKSLQGFEGSISEHQLKEIISSENSYLFFASSAHDACMGMLTIGIYQSPTGKKAWIEDVVVDESFRGLGIGESLIRFAIQFARQYNVNAICLTSSSKRVAANSLYKKIGFQTKETNFYRMILSADFYA